MTRVWCPKWPDGCKTCRTKTRKHHGQGYCTKCYRRQQERGTIKRTRNVALRRERQGQLQHFCFRCETWKSESEFRGSGHWFRTRCQRCTLEVRREQHARDSEAVNARRRERGRAITQAIHEADRKWEWKRTRKIDHWLNNGLVPVEAVQRWLAVAYALHAGDPEDSHYGWERVATVTGVSSRRLYELRHSKVKRTSVDTADKIARSIDAMNEFNEIVRPGVTGWSRHSDYCTRCGRYDVPHHARGFCRRCYCIIWWHRKHNDADPPLVKGERWSMWHESCVMCKTTDHKHQGHGICTACYQQWRRKR